MAERTELHFDVTDPSVIRYLSGSDFHENLRIKYFFPKPMYRLDILLQEAQGKSILHVGCCDHVPLLPAKIAERSWLHGRLNEVAKFCLGVDIDRSGVDAAIKISNANNIICGDVTDTHLIKEISNSYFDYAIFGEVLEHIDNPVQFLRRFIENYGRNIRGIIITVPNAFCGGNLLNSLKSKEIINSDHRFFFTPYTLCKVAWMAGLAPQSLQMAMYSKAKPMKRIILNKFPMLAQNIVYIGKPKLELDPA